MVSFLIQQRPILPGRFQPSTFGTMGLTSMFGMDIGVSPSLLSLYLKVVPSKLYRSITEALCFGRVVKP